MKFKTKRIIKRQVRKVIYFILHPLTNKEINNIKRLYNKKFKNNRAIYKSLYIPSFMFKTNKQQQRGLILK